MLEQPPTNEVSAKDAQHESQEASFTKRHEKWTAAHVVQMSGIGLMLANISAFVLHSEYSTSPSHFAAVNALGLFFVTGLPLLMKRWQKKRTDTSHEE